ncbi:MAG TPA: FUSC family protein, partial [Aggregicoccus sp.]|nr:FUSC family protein [Aggregicoccus sp.]
MHRLLRHLRSLVQIGPGRPAHWAGLRAALATVLPLLVASLLGLPAGFWMGMAGFGVTLADKGGSYRTRAQAMGTLTVLAALAAGAGGAVGAHPWASVLLVVAVVAAASYARGHGELAGLLGLQVCVTLVVSLAMPEPGLAALGQRAGFVVLGGLWAMLLSLGLWPLAPYRPARRAVAEVYRVLAFTAEDLARRVADSAGAAGWGAHAALRHARLRPSVEAARAALAATRLG